MDISLFYRGLVNRILHIKPRKFKKISTTHQNFSNRLNNPRVLDHPEEFLGPNWKAVLNFWIYLETLTDEQWKVIGDHYRDKRNAAFDVARKAAEKTTPYWYDVWYVAYNYTQEATLEIIGSHELLEQQKPFTFLQLFLNP